jgi:hypothetical protein
VALADLESRVVATCMACDGIRPGAECSTTHAAARPVPLFWLAAPYSPPQADQRVVLEAVGPDYQTWEGGLDSDGVAHIGISYDKLCQSLKPGNIIKVRGLPGCSGRDTLRCLTCDA